MEALGQVSALVHSEMKIVVKEGSEAIDRERVYSWLAEAYWSNKRTRETIDRSLQNSMCFTAWCEGAMVGFARVVTDQATFAWLCDVIVAPEHRGAGVGKELVAFIMAHADLQSVRWMLGTRDAHTLYARFGFENSNEPDRFMIKGFAPRPPR